MVTITDDFESLADGAALSTDADWDVNALGYLGDNGVPTMDQHDDHSDLSQVADMSARGDAYCIHQTQVGANDHWAEVDVFPDTDNTHENYVGPIVRGSASAHSGTFDGYGAFVYGIDNATAQELIFGIFRIDNGTPTELTNTGDLGNNGTGDYLASEQHTLRLEVSGSALTLFVDGTQEASTTDSTYSTGQYVGFRLFREVSSTDSQPFVDNFEAQDVAGGSTFAGDITQTLPMLTQSAAGTFTGAGGAPTTPTIISPTEDEVVSTPVSIEISYSDPDGDPLNMISIRRWISPTINVNQTLLPPTQSATGSFSGGGGPIQAEPILEDGVPLDAQTDVSDSLDITIVPGTGIEVPNRVEWFIDSVLFRDDDLESPYQLQYNGIPLQLNSPVTAPSGNNFEIVTDGSIYVVRADVVYPSETVTSTATFTTLDSGGSPPPPQGGNLTTDDFGDYGTAADTFITAANAQSQLPGAISAAADGDIIEIGPGNTGEITLSGSDGGKTVTIRAQNPCDWRLAWQDIADGIVNDVATYSSTIIDFSIGTSGDRNLKIVGFGWTGGFSPRSGLYEVAKSVFPVGAGSAPRTRVDWYGCIKAFPVAVDTGDTLQIASAGDPVRTVTVQDCLLGHRWRNPGASGHCDNLQILNGVTVDVTRVGLLSVANRAQISDMGSGSVWTDVYCESNAQYVRDAKAAEGLLVPSETGNDIALMFDNLPPQTFNGAYIVGLNDYRGGVPTSETNVDDGQPYIGIPRSPEDLATLTGSV